MIRKAVTLIAVLTLLPLAPFVEAQEKIAAPELVVLDRLQGTNVPEFQRYQMLFNFAHQALSDPEEEFRRYYLEEVLGIPAGGKAQSLFEAAVADAWSVINSGKEPVVTVEKSDGQTTVTTETFSTNSGPQPEDFPSAEAFTAEVERLEREKAERIGQILGALERSLEANGFSAQGIHTYVNGELARATTTTSDEALTPEHHIWDVERSFTTGRQAAYLQGASR